MRVCVSVCVCVPQAYSKILHPAGEQPHEWCRCLTLSSKVSPIYEKNPRERQMRWETTRGFFTKLNVLSCTCRVWEFVRPSHVLVPNIPNQLLTAAETVHTWAGSTGLRWLASVHQSATSLHLQTQKSWNKSHKHPFYAWLNQAPEIFQCHI